MRKECKTSKRLQHSKSELAFTHWIVMALLLKFNQLFIPFICESISGFLLLQGAKCLSSPVWLIVTAEQAFVSDNSCLLFKILFAILIHFHLSINLESVPVVLQKIWWDFDRICLELINQFSNNWYLNTASYNTWTWFDVTLFYLD